MPLTTIKQKLYKLLRHSEKWTGTDMVYLAKGGFWLTGSKFVGSATAFALAIAYANLLPKETYAQYKYILSITGLLTVATLPGMGVAITRAVALGYEGTVFAAIKTRLKWSLLGLLTGALVAGYYFYQHNNILGIAFLLASAFTLLTTNLIYGPYLQGKKLFKISAIYNSISLTFSTSAVIGALFLSTNIIFFLSAYFLSNLIIQLCLFFYTYKKYRPNNKKDRQSISFGKHLSLMSILGTISGQLDKILMWHFLGPVQLAIYSFAILPVNQIKNTARSVVPLALPKLATQNKNTLKKTLPAKLLKFSLILSVPTLLYILLAPYLFKILFPAYLSSIPFTKIYALAILLSPLRLIGTAITAHAQKKYLYIIKVTRPIIKISLLAALIPAWGINGAVAALLITTLLGSALSFSFFKKM